MPQQVERIRVRCRSKEGRLVDGWVRSSDKRGEMLNFNPFSADAGVDGQSVGVGVEEGTPPAPTPTVVAAKALPKPKNEATPEPAPEAETETKPTPDE